MAKHFVCIDVYTVKAGDTLYAIANSYDIPVSLLMRVNKICNPYNLRIGMKLCIPGIGDNELTPPGMPGNNPMPPIPPNTNPSAPPTANPSMPPIANPPMPPIANPEMPACRGILHTIKAGDTLYMIAKQYRVNLQAIMDANPDIDPYNLRIGMKLCIPR